MIVFKNICDLVLRTKVALELKGLNSRCLFLRGLLYDNNNNNTNNNNSNNNNNNLYLKRVTQSNGKDLP